MQSTLSQSLLIASLLLTGAIGCADDAGTDTTDDAVGTTSTSPGGTNTGTSPGGAVPWAGRTFVLTVPQENWVEPKGIGPEIGPYVPSFLMTLQAGADNAVSVTMTTSDAAGTQEMCTPTTTTAPASLAYPGIVVGPVDVPVHLKHISEPIQVNTTIRNLTMTNVLPGDTAAEEGQLVATMDAREIYPMFTLVQPKSGDDLCTALNSFEAPCQPCPQDGAAYCLTITAILLGATEAGSTVVPVAPGSQAATCANAP